MTGFVFFLGLAFAVLVVSVAVVANNEEFRSVPMKIADDRIEPMTGIVFWTTPSELLNATSLEFTYLLYKDVVTGIYENKSIKYDWSSFEKKLDKIKKKNHQAIVRMRYADPDQPTAVPDYIKALPGYEETTYDSRVYPDWRCEELMRFHKQFYTDLSARYDGDPRIGFFQSGFGHWAEYHISGTPLQLGVNFPTKEFQAEFFNHIEGLFVETPISFGIESGRPTYSPVPDDWRLGLLSYGLFDDTFMLKTHDYWQCSDGHCGYNEGCLIAYNYTTRFLRAPIGGEIAVSDQVNFLRPEGVHGTTFENASSKYHITYMLAANCVSGEYATKERVHAASKHTGYSLLVTGFKVSKTTARVTVKNTGIAPVYHSFYVTVNGKRSGKSMKFLAPGNSETYEVTGLNIDLNKLDDILLKITSDKLYEDQDVPYDANVEEGSDSYSSHSSMNVSGCMEQRMNQTLLFFVMIALLLCLCF